MAVSLLYIDVKRLCVQCTCGQDEYEQAEDGVQLGEYSQHHGSTESFVTCTDGADTVGTNLGLTDSREQTYETTCQTYTEYSTSGYHVNIGCCQTLQHEETYEAVQTLRRWKGRQTHVGTTFIGVLLESTDSGVTADCYTISTAYARQGNTEGNAQINQKDFHNFLLFLIDYYFVCYFNLRKGSYSLPPPAKSAFLKNSTKVRRMGCTKALIMLRAKVMP